MKVWLHHININHHDVDAMDVFYGDVMRQDDIPEMRSVPSIPDALYKGALAFRVSEGGTQFHLTETDTEVGIRAGKPINPLERGHVAFRTDDLEAFKSHLEAKGIPYVDYGTTFTKQWAQIYFHDPAGTIIEVHQVLDQRLGVGRPVLRFLAIRLAQSLAVLALMSVAIYGLIGLMPGDPIDLAISADPELRPADVERLRALYGLDEPWFNRYLAWAGQAVQGEFGYSRLFAAPVLEALAEPMGRSIVLMGLSLLVGLAIGLPAGMAAGARPHSRLDYTINLICFAGIAMPAFWLALLVIMLFAVTLQWFPASAVSVEPGFWSQAHHLMLPVLTLGLLQAGSVARFMRAAIRDALAADHIRTARAKGRSEVGVIWHHALRNAMIPVVSILALDVGALFSGSLIIEMMFGYPGMGKLLFDAVMGNDYNLALVALLFATVVTLGANFLADVAYAAIDPRVSFGGGNAA